MATGHKRVQYVGPGGNRCVIFIRAPFYINHFTLMHCVYVQGTVVLCTPGPAYWPDLDCNRQFCLSVCLFAAVAQLSSAQLSSVWFVSHQFLQMPSIKYSFLHICWCNGIAINSLYVGHYTDKAPFKGTYLNYVI